MFRKNIYEQPDCKHSFEFILIINEIYTVKYKSASPNAAGNTGWLQYMRIALEVLDQNAKTANGFF